MGCSSVKSSNSPFTSIPEGNKNISLIALGNPLIDILANVDKSVIDKYKVEYGQTTFANEENKGIFEELEKTKDCMYIPGGSIMNSMRILGWVFQMMNYKGEKPKLTLLGCVGNDEYKNKIVDSLTDIGITPLFELTDKTHTSRCGAAIVGKERCLVPDITASKYLTKEFIEQNMEKILSHNVLLMEGYFVVENYEICNTLVKKFNEQGKPVIFTVSSESCIENNYEKIIEICNGSDLIFGNMSECEALAKCQSEDKNEVIKAAFKKMKKSGRTMVITNGKQGCLISKYNYTDDCFKFMCQGFVKKVKGEDIVDTTGAGDSFLGGFVSQWIQGKSVDICSYAGSCCSSAILKHTGCTFDKNENLDFEEY